MKKYVVLICLFLGIISQLAAQNKPFSWDNATVYFLLTDRFNDADNTNNAAYGRGSDPVGGFLGGDFKGIKEKISSGYFDNLGVNALWITAPYEQIHGAVPGYWTSAGYPGGSHYAYHGYYPLDWTQPDAAYGTTNEFQAMVDSAHAHGIRILMDIVLNHTGYETTVDSQAFNFGTLGNPWSVPNNGLDPNNASWCNWWVDNNGVSWIRKGDTATDYCSPACGSGDKQMCLAGLPDVRTDMTTAVGLPKILQTKWDATKETQELAELNTFFSNTSYPQTPANYIVKWLTDWVRDYGVDGFRIDTYKHVETEVWGRLKDQAEDALADWRTANPTKKLDDTPFWMVGELYGAGIGRNADAIVNGKTDATINFNFQTANLATSNLENIYSSYAATFAAPDWTSMSYISSHDTQLFDRNNLYQAGTALLLCPGPVQIYYGDESKRLAGTTGSDQDTRSFMNWSSTDANLLAHWQRIGKFRQNHLAVGAGSHQQIAASPYTFKRVYQPAQGCEDQVVMVIGASGSTTVNVSSVFANGTQLRDAYTGNTATVSGGNVTFAAHANGVILIENPNPSCGPSLTLTPTPTQTSTTTWYNATSLSVAMNAASNNNQNDVKIYYTTNGSTPTASSTLYTAALPFSANTDLTLKAIACENNNTVCSSVKSVRVLVGTLPGFTVYFKPPTSWGNTSANPPRVYWYDSEPLANLANATNTGQPMTAMTGACAGWYSYTFSNILSTSVVFNKGIWGNGNQTGDITGINATSWYDATATTPTLTTTAGCSLCTPPSEVPTVAPASASITLGQSQTLTASGCGSGQTYLWSTNATTAAITVTPTTTTSYTVKCVNSGCEGQASTAATVTVTCTAPTEVPVISPATSSITSGQSQTLTTTGCGTGQTYLWSDNQTTATISVSPAVTNTYTVKCVTANGCQGTASSAATVTVTTPPGITVYFQKPSGWSNNIRVYYWSPQPTGSAPATTWPGETMTDDGNGWFKYTFPSAVTSTNLIFNDNGSNTAKTNDLTINQTAYFPTGCLSGGPIGSNGNWVFADPRTAVAGNFDVFFENTAGWTQPNIYYWNVTPTTGTPAASAWPGSAMTQVSGNLWKFSFTGVANVCLIFNGNGSQTANLSTTNPSGTYNFQTKTWTPTCTPPAAPSLTATPTAVTANASATLQANGCSGTVNWYTAATGGTSLGTGSSFTTPTLTATATYYATCSANGCESTTRSSVTVTVQTCSNSAISQDSPANDYTGVTQKVETDATITATNKIIGSNARVTFDAGKSVTLEPGFEVRAVNNNVFLIRIEGCGGN